MLVDGVWTKKWDPFQGAAKQGDFVRQTSSFRHWVTADGKPANESNKGFKAEPNRYHIYISYTCPWACRTLMLIALKGLQDVISYSATEPFLGDNGWEFKNSASDPAYKYEFAHQFYTDSDPHYTGRATVPILWDKKTETIVNNESADIIEMLNSAFDEWATNTIDLRPSDQLPEILELNKYLYENINNGVYRTGLAKTQQAYSDAVTNLFIHLDKIEERLSNRPYLLGDNITEPDIRLFVTLVRFDAAYFGLFKCNIKRMKDYRNLSEYMMRIYQLNNIAQTVNIEHIKKGYYSIKDLNPLGLVPIGPALDFESEVPHLQKAS